MFNSAKVAFLEKIITEHEKIINQFNDGMINYRAFLLLKKSNKKMIKYINEMPENVCGLSDIKKRIDDISFNIKTLSEKT